MRGCGGSWEGGLGRLIVVSGRTSDDERLLADMEAYFERLARDPEALAAYRPESHEIEIGFETPHSTSVAPYRRSQSRSWR